MKSILPVITGTWEALLNCAKDGVRVIYVENCLYQGSSAAITEKLSELGYAPAARQGKRGVFFLRIRGEHPFDPEKDTIHDPLDIL